MIKMLFLIFALSLCHLTLQCHENWYKFCKNNEECCSNRCYRGEDNTWINGTCKPEVPKEVEETLKTQCLETGNDTCIHSFQCCSGFCFKGPRNDWLSGVCKSQNTIDITKDAKCTPDFDKKCNDDIECCSGYCYRGLKKEWSSGVCKRKQLTDDIIQPSTNSSVEKIIHNMKIQDEQCKPKFYDGCYTNDDCCGELFCDKKIGIRVGTCMSNTSLTILNEKNEWIECFENWYEFCLEDSQCCSGRCVFGANWTYGACAPNIKTVPGDLNNSISDERQKRSVSQEKLVVCYVGLSSNQPTGDRFVFEDIDPNLCTHLVYGFAKLESNRIAPFDPWFDLSRNESGGELNGYNRFTKLKKDNPSLKTLISIGGPNEDPKKYSQMASSNSSRNIFANSVVDFLEKYGFDGLDLSWEYPSVDDRDNLNHLLQLLKSKLNEKLLTMTVSANPRTVDSCYDVAMVDFLDYISVMTYNYHSFGNITGHNAPLYGRPDDQDQTLHAAYAVDYWLKKGVSPKKLLMGLPFYGRSVTLESKDRGVGAPSKDNFDVVLYREICKLIETGTWIEKWDPSSMVPYIYNDSQWISYDNKDSLAMKVHYVMSKKLGGVMIWSLEGDDYLDKCNGGQYVLLNSIKSAIRSSNEQEQQDQNGCSESGVDGIPVVAQFKSLWELINGREDCAKQTQENFIRKAPIVSQITSLAQLASGDEEGARETQILFVKNLEQQVNSVPVVGHVKAAVHCALEEFDTCRQVALSATRPVAVIGSGVAGVVVGGPAGAVAAGVAAGTAFDGIHTGIESAVHRQYRPQGVIASGQRLFTGQAGAGEQFDTVFGIAGDGLLGSAGGQLVKIKPDGRGSISKGKVSKIRCRRSGERCLTPEDFKPSETLQDHYDLGSPFTRVQTGENARVEFAHARILPHHLRIVNQNTVKQQGTGTKTNQRARAFSNSMARHPERGTLPHDAGHVIARRLGGTGTDIRNIFPQNKRINRGPWRKVEQEVFDEVQKYGEAEFTVMLKYENQLSRSPSILHYRIKSAGNDRIGKKFMNVFYTNTVLLQLQLQLQLYLSYCTYIIFSEVKKNHRTFNLYNF